MDDHEERLRALATSTGLLKTLITRGLAQGPKEKKSKVERKISDVARMGGQMVVYLDALLATLAANCGRTLSRADYETLAYLGRMTLKDQVILRAQLGVNLEDLSSAYATFEEDLEAVNPACACNPYRDLYLEVQESLLEAAALALGLPEQLGLWIPEGEDTKGHAEAFRGIHDDFSKTAETALHASEVCTDKERCQFHASICKELASIAERTETIRCLVSELLCDPRIDTASRAVIDTQRGLFTNAVEKALLAFGDIVLVQKGWVAQLKETALGIESSNAWLAQVTRCFVETEPCCRELSSAVLPGITQLGQSIQRIAGTLQEQAPSAQGLTAILRDCRTLECLGRDLELKYWGPGKVATETYGHLFRMWTQRVGGMIGDARNAIRHLQGKPQDCHSEDQVSAARFIQAFQALSKQAQLDLADDCVASGIPSVSRANDAAGTAMGPLLPSSALGQATGYWAGAAEAMGRLARLPLPPDAAEVVSYLQDYAHRELAFAQGEGASSPYFASRLEGRKTTFVPQVNRLETLVPAALAPLVKATLQGVSAETQSPLPALSYRAGPQEASGTCLPCAAKSGGATNLASYPIQH